MKRTDRLFAIVVDLQARPTVRAEDLAACYETSVRTIYGDVMALCEAGIPVISLPGQGYALPPGFFLPPLSFALEEVAGLLLGADYVAQTLDPAYRAAADARSTDDAHRVRRDRPCGDDGAAERLRRDTPTRRRPRLCDIRTHSEASIAPYVLGWDSGVRVLEPLSLRERVVGEARRIRENAPDTLLSGAIR